MFEFEDMSTGFHDVFLNKYADSSGPILDLYISDSMQDMLDIDIRTEVATVVGGTNEFTSLVNDLPSLEIESNSNDGEISWLNAPKWSATNDLYADVGACVNPNSVMPIITSSILNSPKAHVNLNTNNYRTIHSPPPSPKECKSHLTFSPHQIKVPSIQEHKRPSQLATTNRSNPDAIKKDLLVEIKKEKEERVSQHVMTSNGHILSGSNTIKLAPGIGGLTFANSIAYTKLKHTTVMKTAPNALSNNVIIKKERDSSPLRNVNTNAINHGYNHVNSQNVGKILARNILVHSKNVSVNGLHSSVNSSSHGMSNNCTNNSKTKVKITEHEYPKPAYSYSCLIAMALKNSRSGSLPVSEIYSFMCEHFPYFKTAPNGWKNSVRHNLSLNKCFEKIEKPATNGGQRKGCLWAMNPTKISKMDEEVQKWSRKDPMAIRKAMVYPENLDALERGEMKHGSSGDSDGEIDGEIDVQSDIEENSDSEQDNDIDEHLIETPESMEDEEEEKEYDIEITDIYDGIDLEDNKEALRLAIQRNEILDLPDDDYPSPKRARLDVNYSIGPAGAFEHHQIQQQRHNQSTHHSRRKMPLVNRIV